MPIGYLHDPFLDECDTFDCLTRAHSRWLEGRYADGIIKAVSRLEEVLRKRCCQARWNPKRFARRVCPPTTGANRNLRNRTADRLPAPVADHEEVPP